MSTVLSAINPGFLMLFVGLACCLITARRVRQTLLVAAPLIAIWMLTQADQSVDLSSAYLLGLDLVPYRVDALNFIFALAFMIAALLNAIYGMHADDPLQEGAALAVAGAAVSATLAGDLVTLFIFWELTAIIAVFLVLRAGTRAAYFASMRYLALQVLSGVMLLDGIAYVQKTSGDLSLNAFSSLEAPGAVFVLLAIAIKAAFPLVHNWLQDAYPKATVLGAVVLSAFTTKLAVYAAARLFPGLDLLIWIGAAMAVFPIFFAVMVNDLRKVLCYGLNSQIGFMICAVGIGTPLALNGAAAHAFTHIIFQALLFMSIGAVLYRTGTARASELGGLYQSMPLTAIFGLIGAAASAALPLMSGFAAVSLTMSAVAQSGLAAVWLMLLFALAGTLVHSGLKVPIAAFFGTGRGWRVDEAPFTMLLAMGLAAGLTVLIGLPSFAGMGYGWLYALLPFPDAAAGHRPFLSIHVLPQLQLLALAGLAFLLVKRLGLFPSERPGTVLDTDWVYRRLGYGFASWANAVWAKAGPALSSALGGLGREAFERIEATFSPRGMLSRGPLTGGMAIWTAALLGLALLLSFVTVG